METFEGVEERSIKGEEKREKGERWRRGSRKIEKGRKMRKCLKGEGGGKEEDRRE